MLNQVRIDKCSIAKASQDVVRCVDEDASKIPDVSIVESSAEMLYGLVHQRYILTRAGLQAMVFIIDRAALKLSKPLTPISRSTSMKAACLEFVLVCTVWGAMWFHVGVPTCQV